MLTSLSIKNYAIIDELEIDFSNNLNIITGETGAGKSIIVGALSLILGARADTTVLVNKKKKCIIEGIFSAIDNKAVEDFWQENQLDREDEIIIRREIAANGKSRAFINDTPVKLTQLEELSTWLVDLHQQFDVQELVQADFQLQVVDAMAGHENLLKTYRDIFQQWKTARQELMNLQQQKDQFDKEADYNQFQFEELQEAGFKENELEEIEAALVVQAARLAGQGIALRDIARELNDRTAAHGERTAGRLRLQQYSTPLTICSVAADILRIRPEDVVLEPTAGNGALAIGAAVAGARVEGFEIDESRAARGERTLREAGASSVAISARAFPHKGENAEGRSYDVVLANPPFEGLKQSVETDRHGRKLAINRLDHRIVYDSLEFLKADTGRAFLVLPGEMKTEGKLEGALDSFNRYLHATFEVAGAAMLDGVNRFNRCPARGVAGVAHLNLKARPFDVWRGVVVGEQRRLPGVLVHSNAVVRAVGHTADKNSGADNAVAVGLQAVGNVGEQCHVMCTLLATSRGMLLARSITGRSRYLGPPVVWLYCMFSC